MDKKLKHIIVCVILILVFLAMARLGGLRMLPGIPALSGLVAERSPV